MLHNISFCTCRVLSGDENSPMRQCMTFSFTDRALKMFSPAFLRRISTLAKNVDCEDDGFEIGRMTDGKPRLAKIRKLDDNLWRIPTNQLDSFARFLFKYLPAEIMLPSSNAPQPPECDCALD